MGKRIASCRVATPVLRIRTRVRHNTPRTPTAIERALLHSHARLCEEPAWAGTPVGQFFSEILRLRRPGFLVGPALDNLRTLGVVQVNGPSTDLDRLSWAAIERTTRGDQMLKDDLLPGKPQEDLVEHVYDPIERVLFGAERRGATEPTEVAALDAAAFADMFPESALAELVPTEKHQWHKPQTRIESLTWVETTVQWQSRPATLELGADGILELTVQGEAYNSYASELQPEVLFERLIEPVLQEGADDLDTDELPTLSANKLLESCETVFPIGQLQGDADELPGLHVFRPLEGLHEAPAAPRPHMVCVVQDEEGDGEVEWDEGREGALIRLQELPLPAQICHVLPDARAFGAARTRIKCGTIARTVPLGLSMAGDSVARMAARVTLQLDQDLAPEEAVRVLWCPTDDVFGLLIRKLVGGRLDFRETAAQASVFRDSARALRRPVGETAWRDGVTQLLCSWLAAGAGTVGPESLGAALRLFKELARPGQELASSTFASALAALAPVERAAHLASARQALSPLLDRGRLPYPSVLYPDSVVGELVCECGQGQLASILVGGNALEEELLKLDRLCAELGGLLKVNELARLKDLAPATVLQSCSDPRAFVDAIGRWQTAAAAVGSCVAPDLWGQTWVEATRKVLAAVEALSSHLVLRVDPRFRSLWVLDTSALINEADLLRCFRRDELIIVPKRVLEELDNLKRKDTVGTVAAAAHRKLVQYQRGNDNLIFEASAPDLLPPEYDDKGDNDILSVALRYRSWHPVLLTDDLNLGLKARAESMMLKGSAAFMEDRRPKQARVDKGGGAKRPKKR